MIDLGGTVIGQLAQSILPGELQSGLNQPEAS